MFDYIQFSKFHTHNGDDTLPRYTYIFITFAMRFVKGKGKSVSLQTWRCPEGSRKLRFPDFVTKAQDGGRLSALAEGHLYLPGNTPGTHFC